MPKLIVVTRDGQEREVDGSAGLSVMEVIRESGIDELLAILGVSTIRFKHQCPRQRPGPAALIWSEMFGDWRHRCRREIR